MDSAILYDCEFLCREGSMQRFWCGPHDPDPLLAQIGCVRLDLTGDFAIKDELSLHVVPVDRHGARVPLDPFFTRLTGVTQADIDSHGVALAEALDRVADFAGGAKLWSWGKDELNTLAISCFVAGVPSPLPARRFDNASKLLLKAGMPPEDLVRTASSGLADYYGLPHPPQRAHDALGDALSVARTLQHLLRRGKLAPSDLA